MGKKREEARKDSLDVLARIARQSGGGPIPPKKASASSPAPAPRPARPPPSSPAGARSGGAPLEGKAAERWEREQWRRRRESEMHRAHGIERPPPPPTPEESARLDRDRQARARAESRRARQESLRQLQEGRQRDLQRAANIGEVRGPWMKSMDHDPVRGRQVRRGPPSLEEKMSFVMGDGADSREAWAKRQQEKRERSGNQRRRRGRSS